LYRVRIAEAIVAYRHDRQSSLLWLHAAYAVSVTMLLVAAVAARPPDRGASAFRSGTGP
jgi:hypothetical protein